MTSKNTKRALLASVLSMFICFAMLIGSTFAWFTDTASSAVNDIKSGTFDIDLIDEKGNSLEGKTLEWKAADGRTPDKIRWEPGCTYELQPVYIKNNGNLALKYKIIINGVDGDAKLLEVIDFTYGSFDVDAEGHLKPGETSQPIIITGHMEDSVSNEYQNLSIEGIGITVYATQDTVEKDSNNDQYDKDAEYNIPVNPAKAKVEETKKELKEAIENYFNGEPIVETDEMKAVTANTVKEYKPTTSKKLPTGITYEDSTVIFDPDDINHVTVRHRFKATSSTVARKYGLTKKDGSLYCVDLEYTDAKEFGTPQEYTLQNWSINYSVMSYVYSVLNGSSDDELKSLAKALVVYYNAVMALKE